MENLRQTATIQTIMDKKLDAIVSTYQALRKDGHTPVEAFALLQAEFDDEPNLQALLQKAFHERFFGDAPPEELIEATRRSLAALTHLYTEHIKRVMRNDL